MCTRPGVLARSALAIDFGCLAPVRGRYALHAARAGGIRPTRGPGKRKKVLVIGGGSAGALVAKELQKNRQMNMEVIGFLDDDPAKQRHNLLGRRSSGG